MLSFVIRDAVTLVTSLSRALVCLSRVSLRAPSVRPRLYSTVVVSRGLQSFIPATSGMADSDSFMVADSVPIAVPPAWEAAGQFLTGTDVKPGQQQRYNYLNPAEIAL